MMEEEALDEHSRYGFSVLSSTVVLTSFTPVEASSTSQAIRYRHTVKRR